MNVVLDGEDTKVIEFTLNEQKVASQSAEDTPLLWVIRDEFALKGTKFGCGIAQCVAFDRKNVIGLHHLALTVDTDALDNLYERLQDTNNVDIEFPPEPLGDMPVRHMMCSIPGGIRVEFLAENG